jgi:phytoene dehydrogenase-like protein
MDVERDQTIDTAIVGGGLAGLIAAITAARTPGAGRVVLFEPHPLGGRARCDQRDGFTFNRGPRAIYIGGPAERILGELGVDTTRGGPPVTDRASVVDGGDVHLMPQGPGSALRTSLMSASEKFAFAKAFSKIPHMDPAAVTGQTVTEWLDAFGLRGAPRRMMEALIRVSTYANAPDVLDAGAALANAQAGMSPGVRYLDGGWQTLVDDLATTAWDAGVERREANVDRVVRDPDRPDLLALEAPDGATARAVVLAVGGPDAATRILGATPPSWDRLGPPATVACLELGLVRPPDRRFILGVDEPTYLSTHAPPARLAPEGGAVVHLMRYQPTDDDVPAADQRSILDRLARQAGITADMVVTERFLARMVVSGGLPVAATGGLAGRPTVAVDHHPGVFVAGDWVGPEGLLLDGVASSAAAAGRQAAERSATMALA